MGRFFLDTSALAKLYRQEAGTEVVERLFADRESQHFISRLSIAELTSALVLKVRTGELSSQGMRVAQRRLEADLGRRRFLVGAVRDEHFRHAQELLLKHGAREALRTLDALQLAVAIGLRSTGFVSTFVAADAALCRVASLEHFDVLNPEHPEWITGLPGSGSA